MVVMGADIVNHDEASYIVGSWELLHGRLPYTDFADNKPPLIYVYYAVTQLLAGYGIVGVRLATTLVTLPLTAFAA
jgi:4-amino-4-deoxy-L-arabinose transferase-like glycosyltransferase